MPQTGRTNHAADGAHQVDATRVALLVSDPALAANVAALIQAHMPSAAVETTPAGTSVAPDVNCIVVDSQFEGGSGWQVVRLRVASGFRGAAILLAGETESEHPDAARLGVRIVVREKIGEELAAAVGESMQSSELLSDDLKETRRLIATGRIAAQLQHALNNPLAALLAEAQLLQMEELQAEHQDAVNRIVENCRRIVAISRRLSG